MEFYLDEDGYCRVRNISNPDERIIADFLEDDVMSDYSVNQLLCFMVEVRNGEIESWGAAMRIPLRYSKIRSIFTIYLPRRR